MSSSRASRPDGGYDTTANLTTYEVRATDSDLQVRHTTYEVRATDSDLQVGIRCGNPPYNSRCGKQQRFTGENPPLESSSDFKVKTLR